MAIGDAFVHAECDRCGEVSDPISLTALAQRGSWDERAVAAKLKGMGWKVTGEATVCDACVEQEAESR